MNECFDTGKCVPESLATLIRQQNQLKRGKRHVQMFPIGTTELVLPQDFKRHENFRGIFHYNPEEVTPDEIDLAGLQGRENTFLNLGPFSKADIAKRVKKGEKVTCISEYTFDGVEVRTAAATDRTIPSQLAYFENTKEPDSVILVGVYPDRIRAHLAKVK